MRVCPSEVSNLSHGSSLSRLAACTKRWSKGVAEDWLHHFSWEHQQWMFTYSTRSQFYGWESTLEPLFLTCEGRNSVFPPRIQYIHACADGVMYTNVILFSSPEWFSHVCEMIKKHQLFLLLLCLPLWWNKNEHSRHSFMMCRLCSHSSSVGSNHYPAYCGAWIWQHMFWTHSAFASTKEYIEIVCL